MIKHLNIYVYGKVQGVFYRASTVEVANSLNIKGFVRNQRDGSVYIEAEGEEDALRKLVEWCQKGSQRAIVEQVDTQEGSLKNYSNFATQR